MTKISYTRKNIQLVKFSVTFILQILIKNGEFQVLKKLIFYAIMSIKTGLLRFICELHSNWGLTKSLSPVLAVSGIYFVYVRFSPETENYFLGSIPTKIDKILVVGLYYRRIRCIRVKNMTLGQNAVLSKF